MAARFDRDGAPIADRWKPGEVPRGGRKNTVQEAERDRQSRGRNVIGGNELIFVGDLLAAGAMLLIALRLGRPWIVTVIVIKLVVAILDTPFLYLTTWCPLRPPGPQREMICPE